MRKILITLVVYFLSSSVSIANESDCSGIKKLSKEYLTCKTINIKDSANNVNNKIKEGTKNIFNKIRNKIIKN